MTARRRRPLRPNSSKVSPSSFLSDACLASSSALTQDDDDEDPSQDNDDAEHLVVLVHGLFGHTKHLTTVVDGVKDLVKDSGCTLHVSRVNKRSKSLHGIRVCGDRLVEEIRGVVAARPSLKTISFMSHSLGGLFSRYAIGHGFDAKRGTVFGLAPLHFATICTPHFGCNDAYVYRNLDKQDSLTPCLEWMGTMPVIGWLMTTAFMAFERPVVRMTLRLSGRDLFMRDKPVPIVEILATPEERDGTPYLPALASFAERTCYGNIAGDHVVAWENATIRRKCDLPPLNRKELPYGIVNEDVREGREGKDGKQSREDSTNKSKGKSTCAQRERMMQQLEALRWRRVDVKTKILIRKGAPFTHDNIISKKDVSNNFQAVSTHLGQLVVRSITLWEGQGAGAAKM